ncbi:MAG: conserved phage C-terminal domain-containing protein [Kofleriaceae bacterium]|nr:conserved phage C-terminal domain-containing protein [Kofleriaceae bacterium]
MSRYRKVEVQVWTDEAFRSLSSAQPNGQTLWLYLLTGPRTISIPGVVIGREAVMADDLGWSVEAFREAFAEAFREGLAEGDWKAGLVVLKKALIDSTGEPRDTTKPESPNVIKGWAKSWDEVPECSLKTELLQRLHRYSEALGEAFLKAFREAFAKPLAKPLRKEVEILPETRTQDSGLRTQDSGKERSAAQAQPSPAPRAVSRSGRKANAKSVDLTDAERASCLTVLGKLSDRSGIAYTGRDAHLRLLTAQLRSGVSESDLRKVVAYVSEPKESGGLGWQGNPEMAAYLRPETLFGPKTINRYLDAAISWADRAYPTTEGPERRRDAPTGFALEIVPGGKR